MMEKGATNSAIATIWEHIPGEKGTNAEEQIAAFESLYQVNARPIQPTNGRIIRLHEE